MSQMLRLLNHARSHPNVRITATITKLDGPCCRINPIVQTSHHQTFICLVLWRSARTSLLQGWWGTSERLDWVAAEEGKQTLLGRSLLIESKLKNNAFRKAVVEMCEMVTYLSRTQDDIKNKRHYFLTPVLWNCEIWILISESMKNQDF
jgi:hypothetical protein